ncbi:MAG: alpha/beta fold hydrolase [Hyphomicrobiales bacterium]
MTQTRATTPDGTVYSITGDGPATVVLIHGLGMNRAMWQWQLEPLAARYRVVTYDLFGHGESAVPPATPSLSVFARQLKSLIDHVGADRVAVAGFSLGGMIARRFAMDYPERLWGVAILNSAHARTDEARAAVQSRVHQAREHGPGATVNAALERWFGDDYRKANPAVMELVSRWVLANPKEVYAPIYQVLVDGVDELVSPKTPIAMPALVMTGSEDHGNSPEMSRAIAAEIPGARLVIADGLRHMGLAEKPEIFNRELLSFLAHAHAQTQAFDPREFRTALGHFATGVTVISTTEPDGTPRGFTANSFTSVSLDPPLVLVCIARSAASLDVFRGTPGFSVSILEEGQKAVSGLFATRRADKFQVADWRQGRGGMPVIGGALAWFECAPHEAVEAGDHIILIGRVVDFGYGQGRPLGYYRGSYFTLGEENSLVDAVARRAGTVIGAVYANGGSVLLEVDQATGDYRVPAVGRDGEQASLDRLSKKYAAEGFNAAIEFVYAVFEERGTGSVTIYYRGHATGDPPKGTAYVPLADLDLDKVKDKACRFMLERYAREAAQGGFAIYMGDEEQGTVRPLA